MQGVNFVWTVTLGDVLWLCSALFATGGYILTKTRNETRLELSLKQCIQDISDLKTRLEAKLGLETRLAVLEATLPFLLKNYDEIRRGIGLIKNDR